jgi:hypothetical protein
MRPEGTAEGQLIPLLQRADLVKFARAGVARDEALQAGQLAREIVEHVEARVNPESEPAKRAAAIAKERAA